MKPAKTTMIAPPKELRLSVLEALVNIPVACDYLEENGFPDEAGEVRCCFDWVWMPHAGHFIGSARCQFHLATCVGGGRYLVSTVGEYLPEGHPPGSSFAEIGLDRTYETMVFTAERAPEGECCPFRMNDAGELDFCGYNNANDAYRGHLEMCKVWAMRHLVIQPAAS